MRIVTLDSRMLQTSTLEIIKAVPHFGGDKCENGLGFKSNKYNWDQDICVRSELCFPKHRENQVLTMTLLQRSNLIAIYDQATDMYWVIKNRYSGREGWHTREEFTELVMKEINPTKFWDSLDTTTNNQ